MHRGKRVLVYVGKLAGDLIDVLAVIYLVVEMKLKAFFSVKGSPTTNASICIKVYL